MIDCRPWGSLDRGFNLLDYDTLIVDLLSIESPESINWDVFSASLNRDVFLEFLLAEPTQGSAAVIGDPRFMYRASGRVGGARVTGDSEFLSWVPFKFEWTSGEGTGKRPVTLDEMPKKFVRYVHSIGRWRYSLRKVDTELSIPKRTKPKDEGYRIAVMSYCNTWSGAALVFSLGVSVFREYSSFPEVTIGPIWFMPEANLTEMETIDAALAVLEVDVETPKPAWTESLTAPGERSIRLEQERLKAELAPLVAALEQANEERSQARRFVGLLYEKQRALEPLVRDALRALGAEVEDPPRQDKEEGWLRVATSQGVAHGVLEVKSTRNETFDEQGLKQLEDWKLEAETQRNVEPKGINVGNADIETAPSARRSPFDRGWAKAAERRKNVATLTTVLYMALALQAEEKFDQDRFWASLFETDGVFDSSEIEAAFVETFPEDAALIRGAVLT